MDVVHIHVRWAMARHAGGGDVRLSLGSSPMEMLCFGMAKEEERV